MDNKVLLIAVYNTLANEPYLASAKQTFHQWITGIIMCSFVSICSALANRSRFKTLADSGMRNEALN